MARAVKILVVLMVLGGVQTVLAYNVNLVWFRWNYPSPLEPDSTCEFAFKIERDYNIGCTYNLDICRHNSVSLHMIIRAGRSVAMRRHGVCCT